MALFPQVTSCAGASCVRVGFGIDEFAARGAPSCVFDFPVRGFVGALQPVCWSAAKKEAERAIASECQTEERLINFPEGFCV